MPSLYELTGEYLTLYDILSNQDDLEENEVTELIESSLTNEQIEEKAENYAKIIQMLNAESEAAKAESKRLSDRASSFAKNSDRLKKRLFDAMKITGKEKFKTTLFSFGIQKNAESVNIDDKEFSWNEKWYKERKLDRKELNLTAIKEALQAGENIPGAELIRTESLRIR